MGITCKPFGKNKGLFAKLDNSIKREKERLKKSEPKKTKKED